MPISIELISVLIWGVPLVLLGFLFGTGYFKKMIPPSGCVLMVVGWVMGMATMIAIAVSFPVAVGAFLLDAALGNFWNQLIGRQPSNVIYVNPWLLLIFAIVVISAIVSIAYDIRRCVLIVISNGQINVVQPSFECARISSKRREE